MASTDTVSPEAQDIALIAAVEAGNLSLHGMSEWQ